MSRLLLTLLLALAAAVTPPAKAQSQSHPILPLPNSGGGGSCSPITIGTTTIACGGTSTTLAGVTSLNKVAITAPATGSTLTIADGKTLTASNTLTLAGTDGSTLNIGAGGTLGTAALQNTGTSGANVPLLNGANTWSGNQTISAPAANSVPFTISGYSLTGSDASPLASLSGTINTSGSPDVFKLAVTNTARGANTKLLNIYGGASGTTSLFSVDSSGNAFIPTGAGLFRGNASSPGFVFNSGGTTTLVLQAAGFGVGINSVNTQLFEDSLGVLALRNSSNAQAYRVYYTFTDAANYQRAGLNTAASYIELAAESAGTGAANVDVRLTPKGTGTLSIAGTAGVTCSGTPTAGFTVTKGLVTAC